MTEEKEVVPENNGEEEKDKKEETNGKESIPEEPTADEANEKKTEDDATDLEMEIIRQVEYYFGDSNLPRDRYLSEQTKLDDGWVTLETLLKFNRLSKLSKDIAVVENALKKSTSGLLEVVDKKVRRNPENPIPEFNEERRKEMVKRSIYAKGFPKNSTLDELLTFFKKYDGVENVMMRRYVDPRTKSRMFKGSAFITFKTVEQAEKCLEAKDYKYNNIDLLVMSQNEYTEHKKQEVATRRDKREKKIKPKIEEPAKPAHNLPNGTVLYFENKNEKLSRESIRTALNLKDPKLDIAFIDFKVGFDKGYIRFGKEDGAKVFVDGLEEKCLSFDNDKVAVRVLEGDEERDYLVKTTEEMSKRRKNMKAFKQQKSKSNYKGKHPKRRREQNSQDGPPAKVKCRS